MKTSIHGVGRGRGGTRVPRQKIPLYSAELHHNVFQASDGGGDGREEKPCPLSFFLLLNYNGSVASLPPSPPKKWCLHRLLRTDPALLGKGERREEREQSRERRGAQVQQQS